MMYGVQACENHRTSGGLTFEICKKTIISADEKALFEWFLVKLSSSQEPKPTKAMRCQKLIARELFGSQRKIYFARPH